MKPSFLIFLYSLVFVIVGEIASGIVLKFPWVYISITPLMFHMAGFMMGISFTERSRGR